MNKIISALLLLSVSLSFGLPALVPADPKLATPIRIEPIDADGIGFSEMIYNFNLTNSGTTADTVISNIYDIRKLSLVRNYRNDTNHVAVLVDSLLGQIAASCYDISDSSGQTDSVNTRFTVQGSDYASNNSDPSTPSSDAWYTLRQFTVRDVSAASAQVTTDTLKVHLPMATHNPQFLRVYGENLSTAAQNDSRCRLFFYRPRWKAL